MNLKNALFDDTTQGLKVSFGINLQAQALQRQKLQRKAPVAGKILTKAAALTRAHACIASNSITRQARSVLRLSSFVKDSILLTVKMRSDVVNIQAISDGCLMTLIIELMTTYMTFPVYVLQSLTRNIM